MYYKIFKSSFDGICGGHTPYNSIEEVLSEISYHKGWSSLEQLHESIKKWASCASPGDVYTTQVTAIVALSVDHTVRNVDVCHHCDEDNLDFGELEPVEGGEFEQDVSCPDCNRAWKNVYALTEQTELSTKRKKRSE